MTSDGEERLRHVGYLKAVEALVELVGQPLDDALKTIPSEYRDRVRAEIEERLERDAREVRFYRPGSTIQRAGPRSWSRGWNSGDGYLWSRLRDYLHVRKDWHRDDVDNLDDESDIVLKFLEEPRSDGEFAVDEFRVQGLVLGYVQSGKTANFTSLIAKAADRGYKLIIVLSGIHNSLRAQTQKRLDRELGLVDVGDGTGIGVPPDPNEQWWPLTNSHEKNGDFKPGTTSPAPIQRGMRSIMVVKKNATVLRRLVGWLDGNVPDDLPVLVIDDEADQASINTRATLADVDLSDTDTGDFPVDKELDPSTINGLIRDLLNQFQKVSFVAYTATPFANVLIDPDIDSQTWGADLFPRDFIYSLRRPSAYVGAERIFGRAAVDREGEPVDGLDVIRLVPEDELTVLSPRRRDIDDDWEAQITPSLDVAIIDWLLATAAKDERLGPGISSMLIHTSMRVAVQDAYAEEVREHLKGLKRRWKYERDELRGRLERRWDQSFRPTIVSMNAALDRPFERIEPHLNELLLGLSDRTVRLLNSASDDELDYDADSTQKVVLVGGNRLSRGLTIEDLTVSLYVRQSVNYDTLLQMGRWFGYRAEFVDLTRLWTTTELVSRFEHLALVEEELRDDIAVYERDRLTPLEVAPKIRTHPVMTVTAGNKMGSGRPFFQSYSGERIQTTRFRLGDDGWLQDNVNATRELLSALGEPGPSIRGETSRPTWMGVPWDYVAGFLEHFHSLQSAQSFDSLTAAKYITRQADEYDELHSWTVSVRCAQTRNDDLGGWDLGIEGWGDVNTIERSRKVIDPESIGALVNPPSMTNPSAGDETIDLTDDQLGAAVADPYPKLGNALRAQRSPTEGLLLIYPISPLSKNSKGSRDRHNLFDDPVGRPLVVGVALSFPKSNSPASVEYVIGKTSRMYADDEDDD